MNEYDKIIDLIRKSLPLLLSGLTIFWLLWILHQTSQIVRNFWVPWLIFFDRWTIFPDTILVLISFFLLFIVSLIYLLIDYVIGFLITKINKYKILWYYLLRITFGFLHAFIAGWFINQIWWTNSDKVIVVTLVLLILPIFFKEHNRNYLLLIVGFSALLMLTIFNPIQTDFNVSYNNSNACIYEPVQYINWTYIFTKSGIRKISEDMVFTKKE